MDGPSRSFAIMELGKIESSLGNLDKAKEYFESLLNSRYSAYAIINLILFYIKDNNLVEA